MSNLSKKINLEKLMYLARYLLDVQLEHGVSTAHETRTQDIKFFLLNHEGNYYNLDAQELAWLEEAAETAVQHLITHGKNSYLSHNIFFGYDNEPPDTRTAEQIREARLMEYTPDQIAEAGLYAYEVMLDEDYAGKYTFDKIWNDDFGGVIQTGYDGDDEDPVNVLIQKDIDTRIEVGLYAHEYIHLAELVRGALHNEGVIEDLSDAQRILEYLDSVEDEE
jgi:hypothetical protein